LAILNSISFTIAVFAATSAATIIDAALNVSSTPSAPTSPGSDAPYIAGNILMKMGKKYPNHITHRKTRK